MSSSVFLSFASFGLALFLLPQSGIAAETRCRQSDAFDVRVVPIHGPVKRDLTMTMADIERLAGPMAAAKHYPLLGMALQGFGLAYSVQAAAVPRDDGVFCAALNSVEIRIGWADRTVFIAREATVVGCVYEQALNHQLRHVELEDSAVDSFAGVFSSNVREALAGLSLAPDRTAELAKTRLTDAVVAQTRGLLGPLENERSWRREIVESPEELDRIRSACGGIEQRLREAGALL